ncbi:hypothetical protein BSL78_19944 [Apostichopus japonicus]|uniref:Uncharacterized protein n=1 Tax=Stichopus japonicus TaxID=307972 RepID=A0A2G8K5D2_STIJA|nr:hypothetical protein BSL78_29086 [Apostichopus japonicus]PIK43214.1 hypothetical protein BSL78_19944 [Apostichopus japonicus]
MHWRENFVKELCIVGLSGSAEAAQNSQDPPQRKSTGRSTLPPATWSKSRSTTAVLVGSARTTSRTSSYRSVPRFYNGPQLANTPCNMLNKNLPEIRDARKFGLHGTTKEIHGHSSDVSGGGSSSSYPTRAYTAKTQIDTIKDFDGRTELCSIPTTDAGNGVVTKRTQSRAKSEPTSLLKQTEFRPNLVIKPLKPKLDLNDDEDSQQHDKNDVTMFIRMNQHYKLSENQKEETPRKITTPRLFGSPRGSRPEEGFEQFLTMKSIYRSNDKESAQFLDAAVQPVVAVEDGNTVYVNEGNRNFVLNLRQLSKRHTEKHSDLDTIKATERANVIHDTTRASATVPHQEISKEKLVNSWLETCPSDSPAIPKAIGYHGDQQPRATLTHRKQIVLNVPYIGEEAEQRE